MRLTMKIKFSILANSQVDTTRSALKGDIDQLVYELHELTEDEVRIVEGK